MSRQSFAVKATGARNRHLAPDDDLAVDLQRDFQRGAGPGHDGLSFDLDLHLAGRQLLLRLDLRPLDLEQVVLVAEHARP